MLQSSDVTLSINAVSYAYKQSRKMALDNVSLSVQAGQFCALLGPNGAGKTTLFSLVTRLINPSIGHVEICGVDLLKYPARALAELGVVFQQPTLDLDLSVEQNLRYFAGLNGLSPRKASERIEQELGRLHLLERRKEKVRLLNGGHRRRVEIARALLHEPKLLLLDEASVGLDVPTRRDIVDHVHRLCCEKNIAVLWATHLIDEVFENDQIVLLNKGKVLDAGAHKDLLTRNGTSSLKEMFDQISVRPESALEQGGER